jgi:2-dehydropantoate 2-reductase
MGAGSLGIIIGALIAKGGVDVELVDINRENVNALNTNGARITGPLEMTVPVKARTPEEMQGQYDLVLLLTKQWNNPTALPELLPHLHATSTVCTLQNGIPEESVAAVVGRERTIGGTVGFGAIWREPGVSELASTVEVLRNYAFDIGEMDNRLTPRLEAVSRVLGHVGNCALIENFTGARWAKLLMNATFSGMSAALGCTFGDVLENEAAMTYLARIADETVKTAHAQGVNLITMQDYDFNQFEMQSPGELQTRLMPVYQRIWSKHVTTKASMLQDLEKGRPCEVDSINGHVCAKGREKGIPTPVNDHVVALVKQVEQTKQLPEFTTNLSTFSALYH